MISDKSFVYGTALQASAPKGALFALRLLCGIPCHALFPSLSPVFSLKPFRFRCSFSDSFSTRTDTSPLSLRSADSWRGYSTERMWGALRISGCAIPSSFCSIPCCVIVPPPSEVMYVIRSSQFPQRLCKAAEKAAEKLSFALGAAADAGQGAAGAEQRQTEQEGAGMGGEGAQDKLLTAFVAADDMSKTRECDCPYRLNLVSFPRPVNGNAG